MKFLIKIKILVFYLVIRVYSNFRIKKGIGLPFALIIQTIPLTSSFMKKLLFFAESVSLAHIGRPLKLADWADENGYQVYIATGAKGIQLLNALGSKHTHIEIFSITGETFYQRVNQGKFFYTTAELEKYVTAEIKVISEVQPDFIISDFRLTTAISARVMQVPLINLSNAYWSPHYECKFPAPQTGIFNWMPEKFKQQFFNLLRPIAFKTFGKPLNDLRRKYLLTSVDDFRTHYTAGDYTLYMDHPEFINLEQPPFRHAFLGPVVWAPASVEKIKDLKKNSIYITMGSSGNNQVLTEITKACLRLGRHMVISGLSNTEAENLISVVPELKEFAIIKPLIDAEEVLANCDLTICHGGSGTVYQSLMASTPVLCFPHNPDQGLVAMAVKEGNWGSVISPSQTNSGFIFQAITNLLNDHQKIKAVNQFSKKLKAHHTKDVWLSFLSAITTPSKKPILEEVQ